ncbi:MAG: DUF433 domain-containing protein [Bacteroidia bacterium]|nr:DUF433 domain-containing protein [Bacteroidia bacterium]
MKNYMEHILINSRIMFGKPTIKGTRITVELILEELGAGKMLEDLLSAHPNLKRDDIRAALIFAADSLKGERV